MRKFIWRFHRISGLILILLISLKIYTGFVMVGKFETLSTELSFKIHKAPLLDIPILFFFTFHAMYGLWKIISSRVKQERVLFVLLTSVGILVFLLSLFFVYIV